MTKSLHSGGEENQRENCYYVLFFSFFTSCLICKNILVYMNVIRNAGVTLKRLFLRVFLCVSFVTFYYFLFLVWIMSHLSVLPDLDLFLLQRFSLLTDSGLSSYRDAK